MALGAVMNYKVLLKYDSQAVGVGSSEAAWRELATHASYEEVAQALLQAQYLFGNLYVFGMLVKSETRILALSMVIREVGSSMIGLLRTRFTNLKDSSKQANERHGARLAGKRRRPFRVQEGGSLVVTGHEADQQGCNAGQWHRIITITDAMTLRGISEKQASSGSCTIATPLRFTVRSPALPSRATVGITPTTRGPCAWAADQNNASMVHSACAQGYAVRRRPRWEIGQVTSVPASPALLPCRQKLRSQSYCVRTRHPSERRLSV